MATSANVDILLRVRDEATARLRAVSGELNGLGAVVPRLVTAFGGVGGAVGVAVGAVVSLGAAAFANSVRVSNMVEQLDRAAATTAVGIEPLQAMFKIVRDGGGDTDRLTRALAFFRNEVAVGNPVLKEMGITQGDVEQRFLKVAQAISASSDEFRKGAVARTLFGKSGEELLTDLDQIATKFSEVDAAMERSNQRISEETAQTFRDLDTEMDQLKGHWVGFANATAGITADWSTQIVKMVNGVIGAFDLLRGKGLPIHIVPGMTPGFGGAQFGTTPIPPPIPKLPALDEKKFSSGASQETQLLEERWELRKKHREEFLKRNIMLPFGMGFAPLPGGPGRVAGNQFKETIDEYKKMVAEITSSTRVLSEGLEAAWSGMRSGLRNAFSSMNRDSHIFTDLEKALVRAMVSAIESYIADLVAAEGFKLLLKLAGIALSAFTGNPFAGLAVGAADAGSAPLTAGPGAATSVLSPTIAGRGGNTIYIQSIAAKDVIGSLTSPTGAMRYANDRLFEVMAAS